MTPVLQVGHVPSVSPFGTSFCSALPSSFPICFSFSLNSLSTGLRRKIDFSTTAFPLFFPLWMLSMSSSSSRVNSVDRIEGIYWSRVSTIVKPRSVILIGFPLIYSRLNNVSIFCPKLPVFHKFQETTLVVPVRRL